MKRIIFFILLLIALIATFVSCDTDGDEVISPTISISDDGFWIINGEKTDVKAEGVKGDNGTPGAAGPQGVGIKSVAFDENRNLLITFTDGSVQTVDMPEASDHKHNFGEYINSSQLHCDDSVFIRFCAECNVAEFKKGTYADHKFETETIYPNCTYGGYDSNVCSICGFIEITNETGTVDSHIYSNEYTSNSEFHWKQCLLCGTSSAPEGHSTQDGMNCIKCGEFLLSSASDLERVIAAGKIVVGMECAYAPYNWTTSTPTATTVPISNSPGMYADGYDVQIAKLIASSLGVDLVVTAIEWDGLIPALESGEIDMIIAGMSPTEERKLSIDFSDTYFDSNLVMVVKKDGAYASADDIQDFKDAKITGLIYSFHYDVIDQINGVDKQPALPDFAYLIASLKSGAIDGYVCEKPGAIYAVAANEDLAYVQFAEGKGFECDPAEASISVGIRNDSSLTAEINRILDTLTTADKETMMDAAIARQPLE